MCGIMWLVIMWACHYLPWDHASFFLCEEIRYPTWFLLVGTSYNSHSSGLISLIRESVSRHLRSVCWRATIEVFHKACLMSIAPPQLIAALGLPQWMALHMPCWQSSKCFHFWSIKGYSQSTGEKLTAAKLYFAVSHLLIQLWWVAHQRHHTIFGEKHCTCLWKGGPFL